MQDWVKYCTMWREIILTKLSIVSRNLDEYALNIATCSSKVTRKIFL